jgi:DNA-binding transcriptional LysR family regulator
MLNVPRIGVLRAVARHGSFSGAADALGYTQPAVSRQIATLEAETGAVLVTRAADGARLTEAGEVLVRHAETIFGALDEAETELHAVLGLEAGRLRVSAFSSAAASVMPLAIAEFRALHPHVRLVVEMMEAEESIPRLRCGELDLALDILAGQAAEPVAGEPVQRVHLFDDPMYVALPAEHRLADRVPLLLGDLAQEQWMLPTNTGCPDARMFRRASFEAGFEPMVALESDHYHATLGLVAAGVGVALLPDLAARAARSDVVIREVGLPSRRIVAAVPAGYRSSSTEAMLAVLRAVGAQWEAAGRVLAYA